MNLSSTIYHLSSVIKYHRRRLLPLAAGLLLILLPILIYSIYHSDPVRADSLLALDEGYGSTANDASGNVSGTITGATWKTEELCVKGKCLFFDGSGDYIDLGDDVDLDFAAADSFSINFWFRHAPKTFGTEVILAKLEGSGNDGGYQIQMESDGDITCQIEDDDSNTIIDDTISSTLATYDDNRWHYVTCVKSGTASLTLYIDTVQVDQDTSLNASSTLANDDNFYLGIDGDGASYPYQGFLDEVKVYRSVRTADEIKADFLETTPNRGTSAKYGPDQKAFSDGLVGYWNMENSFSDNSGSNNGLLSTGVATESGKFNYGAEFVAANSQFLYNSSRKLDNIHTISFWANPDATTNYLMSLNTASIQASSGTISTTGIDNAKIFVNGEESTTLTADTWQQVTVTTDSLINSFTTGHSTLLPNTNSGAGPVLSIYCITSNDCKMAFLGPDNESLRFMDCDDATCSTGTISILDGAPDCVLTGGDGCSSSIDTGNSSYNTGSISLYCPTADDCKISYHEWTNSALKFADCADATCSSGSVEILDGMTGCGLSGGDGCDTGSDPGRYSALICPTADDCKIAYQENINHALMFADCANATCSSGSVEILDGYTGCGLTGGDVCDETISAGTNVSLACPAATDCKVSYYDTTNTALMFADCADATCSSGSVEILDGLTGCGLTGGDACDDTADTGGNLTSIACPAADDCKISYTLENSNLYFADCADATCSSGSTEFLNGGVGCGLTGCTDQTADGRSSLVCPAADDCKIGLSDWNYPNGYYFVDCADATCSTGTIVNLDSQSNCTLAGGDGCRTDNRGYGGFVSLSCPAADDCKLGLSDRSFNSINFADCDNATCSSGSLEVVEGPDSDTGTYYDMYCLSADDCKMAYYDDGETSLRFMDCDDATCSSGTVSLLDGYYGCVLTGGYGCSESDINDNLISLYCPTTDDCKITYYSGGGSRSALKFADCDNATCSSGSIELLDGYSGCVLTGCSTGISAGSNSSLYCPSADDCKIAYRDATNTALKFADCADATCSSGTVTILDGMASCVLSGGDGCDESINTYLYAHALYCPSATDCKIAYRDATNTALKFIDCADATCSSGSVEILDGYTGCELDGGDTCDDTIDADNPALYCMATDDCKISYWDTNNSALMFADCSDTTCSSGSVEILEGMSGCGLTGCSTSSSAGRYSALACPATDDCKIVDQRSASLYFVDCANATCSSGSFNSLDGAASCTLTGGDGCSSTIDSGGFGNSIYCSTASDCKVLYRHYNDYADDSLMFGDCDDATCSSGSTEYADTGLPTTIQIGKVGSNYYDGTLDDIRVYNHTFSPAEVQKLYNWAPGPIGYWKMDENSGITTYDSSGNGNIGTMTNSGWVSGKFGSGIKTTIDNALDNTTIGDPSSGIFDFSDTESYTLEAWVKSSSLDGNMRVISKGGGGISDIGYDLFLDSAGNKYPCRYTDGDGSGIDAVDIMLVGIAEDDQWHYIACVMDRNGTYTGTPGLYGYLDGVLNDSNTSLTESSAKDNSSSLIIGEKNTNSEADAIIDDVKIYNYARTPAQIIEDMNAGHPAPGSPIGSAIGHWKFNEGYGDTANNSGNGGSSLDGDLGFTTTCPAATYCPTWTNSGKFGKALAFDSEYTGVRTGIVSTLTDNFAASMWLNWGGGDSSNQSIFKNGFNSGWAIWINPGDSDQLAITCDGVDTVTSDTSLTQNTWQHLLIQRVNGVWEAYINGKNITLTNNTCTPTTPASYGYIGVGTSQTFAFNGSIDEVEYFNFTLTADQIKTLYNQGQAAVMGSLSSESSAGAGDQFSSSQAYCIPGDTTSCSAPVGEWKLDEGIGTTAYDSSSNNSTGTITPGAGRWMAGKRGSAYQFDGSDTIINTVDNSLTDQLTAFTIEAWINPSGWGESNNGFILDKTGTYYLETTSNGVLKLLRLKNDPYDHATATSADDILTLNTWQHVVGVYDEATSLIKLYVNGKEVTYNGTPDMGSGTNSGGTGDDLNIGNRGNYTTTFDGMIDDVRLFNYARTPAQISWDYNRGAPVAWYKFNECTGATAYNAALNGNGQAAGMNGTITPGSGTPPENTEANSCSSGHNYDMWYDGATGKQGASLGFDGNDDYVSIGDPSGLDFSNQSISITLWVKLDNVSSGYDRIISKWGNGDSSWEINFNSLIPGFIFHRSSSGSDDITVGCNNSTSLAADTWYFISAWYNQDDTVNQMGCSLNAQPATTIGYQTVGLHSSDEPIVIGAQSVLDYYLGGQIDDVRIYNYPLTSTQIKNLYNGAAAVHFGP